MHPATEEILRYFEFAHLPEDLRSISKQCAQLAQDMAETLEGPELTAGLRKLLEARIASCGRLYLDDA
jgi:hypothetical protein